MEAVSIGGVSLCKVLPRRRQPFNFAVAECIRGVGETLISGADTAWIVDEVGEQHVGRLFLEGKRLSLRASLVTAAVLLLPILAVFGRTLRKR